MPAIFSALGVFLAGAIRGIIARALASLGMGVVTYAGVTTFIDAMVQMIHSNFSGIPSHILQVLGMAGIDVFMSLVLSAHMGVLTFAMSATGFKRISFLRNEEGN